MRERWRPIFNGLYAVSDKGRVRREAPGSGGTYPGKILKTYPVPGHYVLGVAMVNGRRISYSVHQLVAKAFIGLCPAGKEVNHKDGDKHNNFWKNLEYKTHKENQKHSSRLGLIAFGERNGNSKLSKQDVDKIRKKFKTSCFGTKNYKFTMLGNEFGVTPEMIGLIIRRKNWVR